MDEKQAEIWPSRVSLVETGERMAARLASRAVDAGYILYAHQVARLKVFLPTCTSLAASQGPSSTRLMRTSKVIVAINKDPEAPSSNWRFWGGRRS
jgi:hypothetical protein